MTANDADARIQARPRDRSFTLVLAAGAALYLCMAWRFDFLCDDAYISFRYAKNFALGRGWTFNPGEAPPVEGYSNFLWVVWLALWEKLSVPSPIASRVTSLACGVALFAAVLRFVRERFDLTTSEASICAAFFACLPTLDVWATSGLETTPFALACFLVFERLTGDPNRPRGVQAGACAALAALLRADGALWASLSIAAAAIDLFDARSREPSRALLRALALALAVLVAATLAHVLWRHRYYGEWIPNTARVKAGFSTMRLERGAKYLASFLLAVPGFTLAVLAPMWPRARPVRTLALQSAFVTGVAFAYAIFVGGDFMPMGRFLIVAMPFAVIALAGLARGLAHRGASSERVAHAFALILVLLVLLPSLGVALAPQSLRQRLHFRWNEPTARTELDVWSGMRERAEQWVLLGRALAEHTAPGDSLVAGNVGAIGYETELRLLDLFGLTDPAVAKRSAPLVRASPGHDKAVTPEFFLDRDPTYLSAFLAHTDAPPRAGLPPEWSAAVDRGSIALERVPLSDAFPAGLELRLLRAQPKR